MRDGFDAVAVSVTREGEGDDAVSGSESLTVPPVAVLSSEDDKVLLLRASVALIVSVTAGVAVFGFTVVGTIVEGTVVEGIDVDGLAVDGTAEEGAAVEGTAVDGIDVVGTAVEGTAVDGRAVDGIGVGGTGVGAGQSPVFHPHCRIEPVPHVAVEQ